MKNLKSTIRVQVDSCDKDVATEDLEDSKAEVVEETQNENIVADLDAVLDSAKEVITELVENLTPVEEVETSVLENSETDVAEEVVETVETATVEETIEETVVEEKAEDSEASENQELLTETHKGFP